MRKIIIFIFIVLTFSLFLLGKERDGIGLD